MKDRQRKTRVLGLLIQFGASPARLITALLPDNVLISQVSSDLIEMARAGLVNRRNRLYEITVEGVDFYEEISRIANRPPKTRWVENVRMGIDANGDETKVERAAVPKENIPWWNREEESTIALIDEVWKGLDDVSRD